MMTTETLLQQNSNKKKISFRNRDDISYPEADLTMRQQQAQGDKKKQNSGFASYLKME